MAYSREEFKALVQRLREGSEDAARRLVAEYEDMVRDSVREWLDRQPRPSALDSADFSQMVFLSFFRRLDEYDFDTPEKLAGLLLTMSRNKVVRERRRSSAQKRDASREVPLEKLPGGGSQLPDKKPTLTELAVCKEYWDHQVARGAGKIPANRRSAFRGTHLQRNRPNRPPCRGFGPARHASNLQSAHGTIRHNGTRGSREPRAGSRENSV